MQNHLSKMIIGLDFDGTCVTHAYPEIGENIGAVPVLHELVDSGAKLILWTMRSGKELQDALDWFAENDIPLWGVQKNPEQHLWTDSPKAYAKVYIDDASLGCPLIYPKDGSRPYVDWSKVAEYFEINLQPQDQCNPK